MATYKVDLEDGSSYQVETAEPNTSHTPMEPVTPDLALPGIGPTENLITNRPEAINRFQEELKATPTTAMGKILHPPLAVLKALDIPRQRGEAAAANALMELQAPPEAVYQGGLGPEKLKGVMDLVGRTGKAAVKGLTGERRGELGDLTRRAGYGEIVSNIVGLGGLFGLSNTASMGKVLTAEKGIGEHLPQIMNKDYTLNKAKELNGLLDTAREGYGSLKKDVMNTPGPVEGTTLGDAEVAPEVFKKAYNRIPTVVKKYLESPENKDLYGIKEGDYTIRNLDRMKNALGDQMTAKAWDEAPNVLKQATHNAYSAIRNLMIEAEPKLKPALDAYHHFMFDTYGPVKKILETGGRVVEKKLRSAMQPGAERATQASIESLGKIAQPAKRLIKDVVKFNKRQAFKSGAKVEGERLARLEILRELLKTTHGGLD